MESSEKVRPEGVDEQSRVTNVDWRLEEGPKDPSHRQPDSPSVLISSFWDRPVSKAQEHADLMDALAKSLRQDDVRYSRNTQALALGNPDGNIDDTLLCVSNDFPPISDGHGDTLVYIGPPPRTPKQSHADYLQISQHFSTLHRLSSQTLTSLASPKLSELVGPKSKRAEGRLRRHGLLTRCDTAGIKFYLDLRPPNEDEEAVILVTDLTCTLGILAWHRAQKFFNLPRAMVCGTDDFGKLADTMRQLRAPAKHEDASNSTGETSDSTAGQTLHPEKQVARPSDSAPEEQGALEPEYSPLRHRSALERLLQAIVNGDPRLDSAPKMWTYFALAKYFQCATHERVNGWITKWILSNANVNFIQCNPEATFRIGIGIESPLITKLAFSLLVGEKALLDVFAEGDPRVLQPLKRSVHGRTLALLDEDDRNRVDHAASSLVSRIRSLFADIVLGRMHWLEKCDEFQKLVTFEPRNDEERRMISEGIQLYQDYIRGRIYWLLCCDFESKVEDHRTNPSVLHSFMPVVESFSDTFNRLNQPMRLLTQTFWSRLSHGDFDTGHGNTDVGDKLTWNDLSHSMKETYHDDPLLGIREISRAALYTFGTSFNSVVANHRNQGRSTPLNPHWLSGALALSPKRSSDQHHLAESPEKKRKTSFTEQAALDSLSSLGSAQSLHFGNEGQLEILEPTYHGLNDLVADANLEESRNYDSDKEIRSIREHALQLELLQVRKVMRNSVVPLAKVKDLFQQFVPVAQYRDQYGRLTYTNFLDKTRPNSRFICVYGSVPYGWPTAQSTTSPALKAATQQPHRGAPVFGADHPHPLFNEYDFKTSKVLKEATDALRRIVHPIVYPAHLLSGPDRVPTHLTDTLLCLDDDEWKYLPLWAGGCDDGTGGVFDEAYVPNMPKGGFLGGKRGIDNVAGTPAASVVGSEDSFSDIRSEAMSTVARASHLAARDYDGATVISLDDRSERPRDEGFMQQRELWDEIQRIKVAEEQEKNGKGKARADGELSFQLVDRTGDGDDGETSTVRHADSDLDDDMAHDDVQGDMFGDIDDDGSVDDEHFGLASLTKENNQGSSGGEKTAPPMPAAVAFKDIGQHTDTTNSTSSTNEEEDWESVPNFITQTPD